MAGGVKRKEGVNLGNGCPFSVLVLGDWQRESTVWATSREPSTVSEWPDHQLQQPEGPWICASVLQFRKHSAIFGLSTVSFGFTNYLGGQKEAPVASHCSNRNAREAGRSFIPELPSLALCPLLFSHSWQSELPNPRGECAGWMFAGITPSSPTS